MINNPDYDLHDLDQDLFEYEHHMYQLRYSSLNDKKLIEETLHKSNYDDILQAANEGTLVIIKCDDEILSIILILFHTDTVYCAAVADQHNISTNKAHLHDIVITTAENDE